MKISCSWIKNISIDKIPNHGHNVNIHPKKQNQIHNKLNNQPKWTLGSFPLSTKNSSIFLFQNDEAKEKKNGWSS